MLVSIHRSSVPRSVTGRPDAADSYIASTVARPITTRDTLG